jgi:predicted GNAT family acetyltransferase
MLYTDLANPVSNAIYARLGYVPHRDAAILRFV